MIPLTERMDDLLAYLRSCDRTPSYEEMRAEMGLANVSSVHRIIVALERRGFIERQPHVARCIRILDRPRPLSRADLSGVSTADLMAELAARGEGRA